MAWHETITQMTTTTTTHADNFNAVHGELLENDKDLNSKITVLSSERGYLKSKALENISALSIKQNGKYELFGSGITDIPKHQGEPALSIECNVTWNGRTFDSGVIELDYIYPTQGKYINVCVGGTWQGWKQLATTAEPIPYSLTAKTGFTILSSKIIKKHGFVSFNAILKKTDGSVIQVGNVYPCDIPIEFNVVNSVGAIRCIGADGGTSGMGTFSLGDSGQCYCYINGSNANTLILSACYYKGEV